MTDKQPVFMGEKITSTPSRTRFSIKHYKGSLDFPCDFCNTNCYDNYHFQIDGDRSMVVCLSCLKEVIKFREDEI